MRVPGVAVGDDWGGHASNDIFPLPELGPRPEFRGSVGRVVQQRFGRQRAAIARANGIISSLNSLYGPSNDDLKYGSKYSVSAAQK